MIAKPTITAQTLGLLVASTSEGRRLKVEAKDDGTTTLTVEDDHHNPARPTIVVNTADLVALGRKLHGVYVDE